MAVPAVWDSGRWLVSGGESVLLIEWGRRCDGFEGCPVWVGQAVVAATLGAQRATRGGRRPHVVPASGDGHELAQNRSLGLGVVDDVVNLDALPARSTDGAGRIHRSERHALGFRWRA